MRLLQEKDVKTDASMPSWFFATAGISFKKRLAGPFCKSIRGPVLAPFGTHESFHPTELNSECRLDLDCSYYSQLPLSWCAPPKYS